MTLPKTEQSSALSDPTDQTASGALSGAEVFGAMSAGAPKQVTSAQIATLAQAPIANGTATSVGTLTGAEIATVSRGAGFLSATLSAVATFILSIFTILIASGVGAVARTILAVLLDQPVSVKNFGVQGNGTDEGADIQAALNFVQLTGATLAFPGGSETTYGTTTTLSIPSTCSLKSSGGLDNRPFLKILNGENVPLIKATAPFELDGINLIGSASSETPLQKLLWINNTNNASLKNSYLLDGYDLLYIDGTSFYTDLDGLLFGAAYNSQFSVNSDTEPGVDLIIGHLRFLGLTSAYGAKYGIYLNGLGSVLADKIQMSENDPTIASVYFDQPAPEYGGAQINTFVVENGQVTTAPAVYINGSAATPWTYLQFCNVLMTGNNGPALLANYAAQLKISTGATSSLTAGGSFVFPEGAVVSDFDFSNITFNAANGAVVPIQAAAGAQVSGTIVSPIWPGTAALLDFSAATVGYLNAFGGNPGSNATPLLLPNPLTTKGVILTDTAWTTAACTVTATSGTLTSCTTRSRSRSLTPEQGRAA
jgi:hypothetical protein